MEENKTELKLIQMSEIETEEVSWLWFPFIPYGKVTILQGDSGDGKSLMILKLAAMLTRGEPMPFTQKVVIIAAVVCIIGALAYYFICMS